MIGDYLVLVAETLAIWKVLETIIQEELSNVITESDSLIVIQSIKRETKPLSQICNLIEDIIVFAEVVEILSFCTIICLQCVGG